MLSIRGQEAQSFGVRFRSAVRHLSDNLAVPDILDFKRLPGIALNELQRLIDREHRKVGDAGRIENGAFVLAFEATGAEISFGKVFQSIHAKQQHPAHPGNFSTLMSSGELKRVQLVPGQFAHRREALGSNSEVNRFRVWLGIVQRTFY